jgi:hypothetical protein
MKNTRICFSMTLVALTSTGASAHSLEWYQSNLPEAKVTYERCLGHLKGGETLSSEDREECQRASTAIVHHTSFTTSKPVSY